MEVIYQMLARTTGCVAVQENWPQSLRILYHGSAVLAKHFVHARRADRLLTVTTKFGHDISFICIFIIHSLYFIFPIVNLTLSLMVLQ